MRQSVQEHVDVIFRATLALLLLFGASAWQLGIPFRILCGAMLVGPQLLRSPACWGTIVLAQTYCNANAWFSIDNHKYLINYWSLAVSIAAMQPRFALRILEQNATRLIGLCFLFAVFWKFYGGQFLNGEFLKYALLTDSRLEVTTSMTTGLPLTSLNRNRDLIEFVRDLPIAGAQIQVESNHAVSTLSISLSYWTLLIETVCAVMWLIPRGWSIPVYFRDVSLITFVLTTYFVLPVVGFASVLALLGYSATSIERRRMRNTYLWVLLIVQLSSIPWPAFVEGMTPTGTNL